MEKEVRKVHIPGPNGEILNGIDMDIEESSEKWIDMKLHDGTRIRVKTVVTQVVRVDGSWDQEGNPMYIVKSTPMVAIVSCPEYLKKGAKK